MNREVKPGAAENSLVQASLLSEKAYLQLGYAPDPSRPDERVYCRTPEAMASGVCTELWSIILPSESSASLIDVHLKGDGSRGILDHTFVTNVTGMYFLTLTRSAFFVLCRPWQFCFTHFPTCMEVVIQSQAWCSLKVEWSG